MFSILLIRTEQSLFCHWICPQSFVFLAKLKNQDFAKYLYFLPFTRTSFSCYKFLGNCHFTRYFTWHLAFDLAFYFEFCVQTYLALICQGKSKHTQTQYTRIMTITTKQTNKILNKRQQSISWMLLILHLCRRSSNSSSSASSLCSQPLIFSRPILSMSPTLTDSDSRISDL